MNRDLLLVAVSLFTWGVGEGMFYIYQPLLLQEWGASPVQIGMILGAVGVAMAFVQIPAGYVADRVGPHYVMKASWVQGLIAAAVMAFSKSLPMFVIGLLLYGMTTYVAPPMNTYIGRARGKMPLGRALAVNSASYNAGAIIGPLLGGILASRIGLLPILRVAAGIFLVSSAVILFIRAHPAETGADHHLASGSLLKNYRFLAFLPLMFLTLLASYLPQTLTSNYLQNQGGLSLETIGRLSSIGNLSNVLFMLGGSLFPARYSLLVGQVLVGLFALLLWRGSGAGWYTLAFAFIGGYRLLRVMITTLARPLISAAKAGLAYGLIETVNASTVILAPVIAGFLYEREPAWMYIAALILTAAAVLVNLIILPRLQPAPAASDTILITPEQEFPSP